ncbi:Protein NRT1/ PTR FAMILY 6.3 [Hibiscus syriacus]|uniref:Protein NRT1/ PTR FAMILY 6.3 n=1 Tax=Hibiscus syriacus TaxID=106335 RepID=A0A6A2YER7_HIBSY|nr:Protein NRT1/ PTR FAMILY 6.3 [Hibiscus syriacus]
MSVPITQGKTLPDAWDYRGKPADSSNSGGWTSAAMILGTEACERLTTATSATTVTNFLGTSFLLCLLGGFITDTFLGRYLTIGIFATVQATGVTILTISTIVPSLRAPKCSRDSSTTCTPASGMQLIILYLALYMTALGTGGLKSSVSGFGSDQFDESDPEEKSRMTNFFNWFFFFINIGSLCSVTVLVYIQDNLGRGWGYGICACAILIGLVVFLSGTRRYRFKKLVGSPLTQIAAVFVAAWKKRHLELPSDASLLFEIDDAAEALKKKKKKKQKLPHSKEAAIKDPSVAKANKWNLATLTYVEEVKLVIRMLPVWATTIMFWSVHAQMTTFSVSQANTMDRHMGKFQISPASLWVFFIGSILLTVPIYDRIISPIARKVLKNPGFNPFAKDRCRFGSIHYCNDIESRELTWSDEQPIGSNPDDRHLADPPVSDRGSGEAFTYTGQLDFFLRECPKGMKTISTGLFFEYPLIRVFLQFIAGNHSSQGDCNQASVATGQSEQREAL